MMLIVNAEQYHFKNVTAAVPIDFATNQIYALSLKMHPGKYACDKHVNVLKAT